MPDDVRDLVVLTARLSAAKVALVAAASKVRSAEDAIVKATGFSKPEGQESYDRPSPYGIAKLTLKQPINTTVDSEAWLKLRRTLSADHPGRKCFRAKYEVATKEARALQDKKDDASKAAWATISAVITRKPGKISVKVESLQLLKVPVEESA